MYYPPQVKYTLRTSYIYVHSIYHIKYKHCGMIRPWIIHYHEVWKEYYRVYLQALLFLSWPKIRFFWLCQLFWKSSDLTTIIQYVPCTYVFMFFCENGLDENLKITLFDCVPNRNDLTNFVTIYSKFNCLRFLPRSNHLTK